jgi:hypothetical protein
MDSVQSGIPTRTKRQTTEIGSNGANSVRASLFFHVMKRSDPVSEMFAFCSQYKTMDNVQKPSNTNIPTPEPSGIEQGRS